MTTIRVQGRDLTGADFEQIRQLQAEHPQWSRYHLSIALAQQWQWRNSAGQLKDMAARTLLLKLQARGLIQLPPRRRPTGSRKTTVPAVQCPELFPPEVMGIAEGLDELRPLQLEVVQSLAQRRHVHQLLARYHYRGYGGAVGENVQYLANDRQGRDLAVMVFGAAAWKVAARDHFIGWSPPERIQHLARLANQQRFLILPWVRVRHLASHLLALAARRLSQDWQKRYGHPIWLVESFVEQGRFCATSYRAAGWTLVGQTTGRTRQDRHRTIESSLKSVWVRPLHAQFRRYLLAP